MARTPLARALERIANEEYRTTRRGLLRGAGAAVAGGAALGQLAPVARGAAQPKVVIVGAGLAGLTCAYRLKKKGVIADVYEASDRIGGRCWTSRGAFADGQIYEHGGELIDTGHRELRRLIRELGLDTVDLLEAEADGTDEGYWFDGVAYSHAQATNDFQAVKDKVFADTDAAGYPTTYRSFTPRGYELDHMSIVDWIEESVPGGIRSRFGQLLDVAYTIEYGADSSRQSSLNLLYLLGFSAAKGPLTIFGESDERFHVIGGNDQVPKRLADALEGQLKTGAELVRIKRLSSGAFELTFQVGSSARRVTADHVVLALPFSILRSSVDYSAAGFNAIKRTAIEELGMGTNSKLHVQFRSRFWEGRGSNGATYSDTGYQSTWDVTRGQSGRSGILVDYTGGTIGLAAGSGSPESQASLFLDALEPVLPGARSQWNGRVTRDYWPTYEWTKGSYAYFKVGQYTRFASAEAERSGNCHFCGEHTSQDFQGYLNGAVQTGEDAAAEVLADIR
jgi:monoamine oxidase